MIPPRLLKEGIMAFSTMLQGNFGDEMLNSATKPGNLALGTPMILPDGREYRLCKAGGTALTPGLFNTYITDAGA